MSDPRASLLEGIAGLLAAEVLLIELPEAEPMLAGRIAAADAPRAGAALVGGAEDDLVAVGRALRGRIVPGGVVAFVLPVVQSGWRAAAARAFSRRSAARRPRDLEEICTAVLAAGAVPIRVERAKDLALVWGRAG